MHGPELEPGIYWGDIAKDKDGYATLMADYRYRKDVVWDYVKDVLEDSGVTRYFVEELRVEPFVHQHPDFRFFACLAGDKMYVSAESRTRSSFWDYGIRVEEWTEICYGDLVRRFSKDLKMQYYGALYGLDGDDNGTARLYVGPEHRVLKLCGQSLQMYRYEGNGESSAYDNMDAREVGLAEFRDRLLDWKSMAEEVPYIVLEISRIDPCKGPFQYEAFSYESRLLSGNRVWGVRCVDTEDQRSSHLMIANGSGDASTDGYNCWTTTMWPPEDSMGGMITQTLSHEELQRIWRDIALKSSRIRQRALSLLRIASNCSNADFREGQWEAIDGVLHGRRQLVVQRTGWGKSMIYFLAARFLREQGRGMTLLISPLLALMRNQVAAAERVGVKCFTINSTNPNEWDGIRARILSDKADLLIVSPERLANDDFRVTILEPITNKIGLLVIDEAHCVSDWGHDFRPDYKKISRLLEHLPRTVPVLATTATATNRVIADIEAQLGDTTEVSRGNLVRKSLYLQNIRLSSQEARLAWLAEMLKDRIPGSGIIYALTIRDAEIVARWLPS